MSKATYGSITVTQINSPKLILNANTARRGLILCNSNNQGIVYYGFDTNLTTSNGVPLYETQTTNKDNFDESYKGPIYASSTTDVDVRYVEFLQ